MDPELPTQTVFTPGTQLGPYRIEASLGAGGMGEVFRGLDTRLGRPVAIKLAHRQFSDRFEREANAISALNHPHICTLYDVGATQSGSGYLVMELVEGENLEGPLPTDTLMISARDGRFDALVAMYHDQGHIALKLLGMHRAVNVTLGLPIIRTSVAHGTAFDIAWQRRAETGSMIEALRVASRLGATEKGGCE